MAALWPIMLQISEEIFEVSRVTHEAADKDG